MNFGAFVASREGEAVGTVERVILDLATNQVLSYVMHRTTGREGEVVIHKSLVSDNDEGLVLNLGQNEIEKLGDFVQGRQLATVLGRSPSAGSPTVAISARTRVQCVDDEIGSVEGVVIDEFTSEVTDLIVRLDDTRRNAVVPLAWASLLRSEKITLQCSKSDI